MSSEKTEQPTARRLRQAREKGDVPVSAALTQAVVLLAAVAVLPAAGAAMVNRWQLLLTSALRGETVVGLQALVGTVLWMTVPMLGCAAGAAVLFGLVQTGAVVSGERLVPNLEHLNPVEGIKKLFQVERCIQVLRALVGAAFVAWLSIALLRTHAASVVAAIGEADLGLALTGTLVRRLLWGSVGVMLALGLVDLAVVRRGWMRRNRMSKEELKREHREAEGDPHIKQERRRAHQEMLESATLFGLKDASVVVMNPTHLATALRYAEAEASAPRVVAQGQGHLAKQMAEAARAYGIPIVRDVPVAQALHELQVGDEIPEELYEAVAEILRVLWEQHESEGKEE